MNLLFRNINEKKHYEKIDGQCIIIELDKEWMLKRNSFYFEKALKKTIKSKKFDSDICVISQNEILMNYNENNILFNSIDIKEVFKVIIEKPAYLILLLSIMLTFICFIGRIFLYGYYFGDVNGGFTGLLPMIINPVPIDVFSSGVIGLYILIVIGLMYNMLTNSLNKNISVILRTLIVSIELFVLVGLSIILFTNIGGRSSEIIIISISAFAMIPVMLLSLLSSLNRGVERVGIWIFSFIVSFVIIVGIIIVFQGNKEILNYIEAFGFISLFPVSNLLFILLNKLIPVKNHIDNVDSDKNNDKVNEWILFSKWTSQFHVIFGYIASVIIIFTIMTLSMIFTVGKAYSTIPFNNQYSLIKYYENGNDDLTMILGTIVGERNSTYYISKYEDKSILTIKNLQITSNSCYRLVADTNKLKFEKDIDLFKTKVIDKNKLDCEINYVVGEDGKMNYHLIESTNKDYNVKVYYSEFSKVEIGKILIEVESLNDRLSNKNDIYYILEFYLDYFNLKSLSSNNDEYYYLNGVYKYTEKVLDEYKYYQYYFKNNEAQ